MEALVIARHSKVLDNIGDNGLKFSVKRRHYPPG
jgi:hypothetical protein